MDECKEAKKEAQAERISSDEQTQNSRPLELLDTSVVGLVIGTS